MNYLEVRNKAFSTTNDDLLLDLDNNQQVFLGVIDIPVDSKNEVVHMSLILKFDDEVSIVTSDSRSYFDLDFNDVVADKSMVFLASFEQLIPELTKVESVEHLHKPYEVVYVKCLDGIYMLEMENNDRVVEFVDKLLKDVLVECFKNIGS